MLLKAGGPVSIWNVLISWTVLPICAGTYGDGGIPHSAVEEKAKLSTSTVGMLDAGSSTPRNLPSVVSTLHLSTILIGIVYEYWPETME